MPPLQTTTIHLSTAKTRVCSGQVRELAHRYFGEWNPPSLSPSELATWRSDAAPAGDARRDGPKSFSMTLPAGPYLQEGRSVRLSL